ncbi:hypothetical protein HK096_003733 [Nowakowskiella sp. JEL0078]|nr:hypothetical protein HK096_003733 [Nowakowskiella sp. JEL0078]
MHVYLEILRCVNFSFYLNRILKMGFSQIVKYLLANGACPWLADAAEIAKSFEHFPK